MPPDCVAAGAAPGVVLAELCADWLLMSAEVLAAGAEVLADALLLGAVLLAADWLLMSLEVLVEGAVVDDICCGGLLVLLAPVWSGAGGFEAGPWLCGGTGLPAVPLFGPSTLLPVGLCDGLVWVAAAPPIAASQLSASFCASCTLKLFGPLCAFTDVLSVLGVPRTSTCLLTMASRPEVLPLSW